MPVAKPASSLRMAAWSAVTLCLLATPLQATTRHTAKAAPVALIGPIARSTGAGETMGCEKVTMNAADVARYFATATEVSPGSFHEESIILPCSFSGRLTRAGQVYDWNINATGAGYLRSEDGQQDLRYLCRTACEKALPQLTGL
jgi:hypothetical protein